MASATELQSIRLDHMCANRVVVNRDQNAAQDRTRDGGLIGDCVNAGYRTPTAGGKLITFDLTGNQKAK